MSLEAVRHEPDDCTMCDGTGDIGDTVCHDCDGYGTLEPFERSSEPEDYLEDES